MPGPEPLPLNRLCLLLSKDLWYKLSILTGLFSLARNSMGVLGVSVHRCAYILAVMRLAVGAGVGIMLLLV